MHAIDLLLSEHEKARALLLKISRTSVAALKTREETYIKFRNELLRHENMEQAIWYPFLEKNMDKDSIIEHLIDEEKSAEKLFRKLEGIDYDDNEWMVKFLELRKEIEHHATEEETKLFPSVKRKLTKAQLVQIGEEMQEFNQLAKKRLKK